MRRSLRDAAGRVLLWVLVACIGSAWIARAHLEQRRAAFETDARIAHRLLSQRVVEHDAIMATLALLQPGTAAGEAAPEQRLPSVYPQVLKVWRHDAQTPWPVALAEALAAGAAESRGAGRAALAQVDLAAGHYLLVQAAQPAAFALQIDLDRIVPQAEWPLAADGAVRLALQHGGQARLLVPGRETFERGWAFRFRKTLAAESQPFEVAAEMRVGWSELPWVALAAWAGGSAVLIALGQAWLRQRAERRRAQELLRLGQVGRLNALGELAAGMAHEVNQPLTAVLASADAARRLLGEDPPELDAARRAIDQAARQSRRAAEVIGRLRRTVERPQLSTRFQPVRLDETVRGALDLLRPECAQLGVEPSVAVDASARSVQGDAVALEQIVHNLLSNALHALSQVPAGERRLEIGLAADDGQARLDVRDSGPGIAPEDLPRVFEPFFSTREGGLGLGLSLCETLATGMGGTLVAANAPGRGALFTLRLPLAGRVAP